MNEEKTLEIVNKIFNSIFDENNKYNLDEILEHFAFDIKLPKQVNDSITNEITWADSINNKKFITNDNMIKIDTEKGWMLPFAFGGESKGSKPKKASKTFHFKSLRDYIKIFESFFSRKNGKYQCRRLCV